MHDEDQIPIWLFIGGILSIYGFLILGAGISALISPPPVDARVALFDFHADVWWGILMTGVGLFYVVRYWPRRQDATKSMH